MISCQINEGLSLANKYMIYIVKKSMVFVKDDPTIRDS
jgi:hypothetical protein